MGIEDEHRKLRKEREEKQALRNQNAGIAPESELPESNIIQLREAKVYLPLAQIPELVSACAEHKTLVGRIGMGRERASDPTSRLVDSALIVKSETKIREILEWADPEALSRLKSVNEFAEKVVEYSKKASPSL